MTLRLASAAAGGWPCPAPSPSTRRGEQPTTAGPRRRKSPLLVLAGNTSVHGRGRRDWQGGSGRGRGGGRGRGRGRSRGRDGERDVARHKAIQLNRALRSAHTAADLEEIIAQSHESFDNINVATALTLLGRMENQSPAAARGAQLLQANVQRSAPEYGPQGIANCAAGLAKVIPTDCGPSLESLASAAVAKLEAFNTQELAMTAWALAKASHPAPDFYEALRLHILRQRPSFKSQELANVAWAFATAGVSDPDFFSTLEDMALPSLSSFTPQGLSMISWAFATAGVYSEALFLAVENRALRQGLRSFSAQGLTLVAWAFAKAGRHSGELFRELAVALIPRVDELGGQGLTMVAWSFATARHRSAPLFAAISQRACRVLPTLSPHGLSNLASAFASLSVPAAPLFEVLAAAALTSLRSFNSLDLATLASAFATQRHDPQGCELLAALADEAVARRLEPLYLTRICWAFASLGRPAPQLFRQLKAAAINGQEAVATGTDGDGFQPFDAQQLAMAAWALAVFGLLDVETLRRLSRPLPAEADLQDEGLHSFFQAELAVLLPGSGSGRAAGGVLPPELHEEAKRCWLKYAAATRRSGTQRQVEVALRKLGLRCVGEWRTADGLFAVDIMARVPGGGQLAVEVDGPTHFTCTEPRRPLGASNLRRRLLAFSLSPSPVIFIPYYEWDGVKGNQEAEERYLLGILRSDAGIDLSEALKRRRSGPIRAVWDDRDDLTAADDAGEAWVAPRSLGDSQATHRDRLRATGMDADLLDSF